MPLFSLYILFFFVPLAIDRITKYAVVVDKIQDGELTSFLDIYLTYNRGISWGIGNCDHQGLFLFISCLVAGVIFAFCWYMHRNYVNFLYKKNLFLVAFLFIISGAISNLFDRVWYCGVVDFIQFHWCRWYFPVFNFADVFISLGVCLLLYQQVRDEFF